MTIIYSAVSFIAGCLVWEFLRGPIVSWLRGGEKVIGAEIKAGVTKAADAAATGVKTLAQDAKKKL